MDKKLCPLKFGLLEVVARAQVGAGKTPTENAADANRVVACDGEDCEWWVSNHEKCALPCLADRAQNIVESLHYMK